MNRLCHLINGELLIITSTVPITSSIRVATPTGNPEPLVILSNCLGSTPSCSNLQREDKTLNNNKIIKKDHGPELGTIDLDLF